LTADRTASGSFGVAIVYAESLFVVWEMEVTSWECVEKVIEYGVSHTAWLPNHDYARSARRMPKLREDTYNGVPIVEQTINVTVCPAFIYVRATRSAL
jgi:hypothetical protein